MKGGFIKLPRSVRGMEIYKDAELFRLYVHCLLSARYKDAMMIPPNCQSEVLVKRGEFLTTREILAEELGYRGKTTRTLWNRLLFLQNLGLVSINSSNKFSTVTVCNYDTCSGKSADDFPTTFPANFQQPFQQISNNPDSYLSSISKNGKERKEEGEEGGSAAPPPSAAVSESKSKSKSKPNTEAEPLPPGVTPEMAAAGRRLAEEWAHLCTRHARDGSSADQPIQFAGDFTELVRLGHDPEVILESIRDPKRNRNEVQWEWRKRFIETSRMNNRLEADVRAANKHHDEIVKGMLARRAQ